MWSWCLLSTMTCEVWQGLGQQGDAEDRSNARTGLRVKMVAHAGHGRKGNCGLATHTSISLLPARGTAWCRLRIVLEICPKHWKTRRIQREIWMFGSSQKHLLTLGPQTQGSRVPWPHPTLATPHSHCTPACLGATSACCSALTYSSGHFLLPHALSHPWLNHSSYLSVSLWQAGYHGNKPHITSACSGATVQKQAAQLPGLLIYKSRPQASALHMTPCPTREEVGVH